MQRVTSGSWVGRELILLLLLMVDEGGERGAPERLREEEGFSSEDMVLSFFFNSWNWLILEFEKYKKWEKGIGECDTTLHYLIYSRYQTILLRDVIFLWIIIIIGF